MSDKASISTYSWDLGYVYFVKQISQEILMVQHGEVHNVGHCLSMK